MSDSDYKAIIAVLEAENAELRIQVSCIPLLESEHVALRQQILQLEQKLLDAVIKMEQMAVRKDSSNSSMPPSGDLHRKTQSLRKVSDRKAGGQPGHKGTTLKMTDRPDHVEPLVPLFCAICAKALDVSAAKLVERRQMVDIPPIKAELTEFRAFGIRCACGHHQVASFPEGVDNHIQYGPNITALTVYHNVYQYVPFKRLHDFFTHICNVPLSLGTLENIVLRMAVSASRGSVLINALFPNGFPFATLCSDRWKAQLKTNAKNHQLCLAHLLRELEYLIQAEKASWANQFKELLLQAIHLKQNQKAYHKDHPQTLQIEQQLDTMLGQSICEQNTPKTISFKNSMAKYRQFILPFLYDPLITYDNNASERGIRNVKVKLKVSGQFKTGQEQYCILRSIIDTTIKNGQSVFDAIAAVAHLPAPPKAAV